jgi:hypothetical protein
MKTPFTRLLAAFPLLISVTGSNAGPINFGSGVNNTTQPTGGYNYLHWCNTPGYRTFQIVDTGANSTIDSPTPAEAPSRYTVPPEKSWSSRKAFARRVALQNSGKRSSDSAPESTTVASHAVPDGGASIYLLGGSLIGLAALRKSRKM